MHFDEVTTFAFYVGEKFPTAKQKPYIPVRIDDIQFSPTHLMLIKHLTNDEVRIEDTSRMARAFYLSEWLAWKWVFVVASQNFGLFAKMAGLPKTAAQRTEYRLPNSQKMFR